VCGPGHGGGVQPRLGRGGGLPLRGDVGDALNGSVRKERLAVPKHVTDCVSTRREEGWACVWDGLGRRGRDQNLHHTEPHPPWSTLSSRPSLYTLVTRTRIGVELPGGVASLIARLRGRWARGTVEDVADWQFKKTHTGRKNTNATPRGGTEESPAPTSPKARTPSDSILG
jgi:hypothetical protein